MTSSIVLILLPRRVVCSSGMPWPDVSDVASVQRTVEDGPYELWGDVVNRVALLP